MNNTFKSIKIESNNQKIYSIILNRPAKKNALNNTLIYELTKAFKQLNDNNDCKVIILSSNSDCFCSGADLDDLKIMQKKDEETNMSDSEKLMNLYKSILYNTKLTIAKVDGPAIAGGCGLATACDIIFASKNSKFGYSEVKIGFVPALVSVFLSMRINKTIAKELFLTGKIINGEYAKEIGLINYLYDKKIINEKVDSFCKNFISKSSSESVKETKRLLLKYMDIDKKFEIAKKVNAKSRKNKDCIKGINSFLKKEKINWSNDS